VTYTGTLAAAAVKVAASFGVHATDPVILADGANVIVHLTRGSRCTATPGPAT
jgi:hypothetical protein